MEPLGTQLRRQRRRLGLSLDDVARMTGISKPYLSLVETNKTKSPPSDEKLTRLEQALKFPDGALVVRAHLARTPADVRGMLQSLLHAEARGRGGDAVGQPAKVEAAVRGEGREKGGSGGGGGEEAGGRFGFGINLDHAYLTGALHALVEERSGNMSPICLTHAPVVNKVSAGYPRDFTDLAYPARVADEYVPTPAPHAETPDPYLFAARVHGDSMSPTYSEGDIVTFSTTADPQSGQDCFVRLDTGQTTFKRVFFESNPAGESLIRLQPLNPAYKSKSFPAQRISGLYRAVWVSKAVRG